MLAAAQARLPGGSRFDIAAQLHGNQAGYSQSKINKPKNTHFQGHYSVKSLIINIYQKRILPPLFKKKFLKISWHEWRFVECHYLNLALSLQCDLFMDYDYDYDFTNYKQ